MGVDDDVSLTDAGCTRTEGRSHALAAQSVPTELAPDPDAAQAWSAEVDVDPYEAPRGRSWLVPGAVFAAAVAVAGVIVAGIVESQRQQPAPAAPVPTTSAPVTTIIVSTVEAAPPPPVTATTVVTVVSQQPPVAAPEPPPSAGIPNDAVTAYDRRFIARLRSEGWDIWDEQLAANNAHATCAMFRQGAKAQFVNSELSARTGMSMGDTLMFTSAAMLTYPNCP